MEAGKGLAPAEGVSRQGRPPLCSVFLHLCTPPCLNILYMYICVYTHVARLIWALGGWLYILGSSVEPSVATVGGTRAVPRRGAQGSLAAGLAASDGAGGSAGCPAFGWGDQGGSWGQVWVFGCAGAVFVAVVRGSSGWAHLRWQLSARCTCAPREAAPRARPGEYLRPRDLCCSLAAAGRSVRVEGHYEM